MNVSSVKNLNGEVFSAVQDASLTNVVQTNSGNWQDITAYQNASATYLTAVDLSPYATETLVEETSGAITSLIPTDYYPDTNPSGFISGVDLSPYATTAEVDTLSSMLSGAIDYVSANAGNEFPVSADEAIQYVQTNSGTIDYTVTSYQTNSGTFLTAHQDISNLMPKSESANFYPMTGNPSGFINELPDEEEIEFEEINLSSFATSSQVNYLSGAINYVSANVGGGSGGDAEVNNYVYTNSAAINGTVSNYQTNSASYITELPDEEEIEFEELDLSGYALASALDNKQNLLTGITDVQVVQSLPVSPVSTVLYLIPEV